MRRILLVSILLFVLGISSVASAQLLVPFDVGVGPAAHFVTGPVFRDRAVHFGLRINTYAIIDQATRKKYRNRIPPQYRQIADQPGDIRLNPLSCCIPSTLYISPAIPNSPFANTGMYGLTMKPLGLGFNTGGRMVNFQVGLGLLATYIYIHSKTLPSPTNFLRPGIEARAEVELMFSKNGGISFGWASQFYPPQEVGGSILKLGPLDKSIWHIGQAFLMFHVRKPVAVNL